MTVDDSDAREAAAAQAGPTLGLRRNAPASRPEPACNPDRLWYVAQAAGLDAPSPEVARILELGCGEGGNLLPLAYRLPTATITGVDEDPKRLRVAHGDAQTLSLGGLELHATSPMRFEGGPFDYVLAPDLLFRPNATAEPVLAQLSTLLAPTGVAFLRYPTPDGRLVRERVGQRLRDLLAAEGAEGDLPRARGLLMHLLAHTPADAPPGVQAVAQELARAVERDDRELTEEYLSPPPTAYDREALRHLAEQAGLTLLADLGPDGADRRLGEAFRQSLAADLDLSTLPMAADLLLTRDAHTIALRRTDAPIGSEVPLLHQLRLGHLFAPLRCLDPEPWLGPRVPLAFETFDRVPITLEEPLAKAAFLVLAEAYPRGLTFVELVDAAIARLARTPGAAEVDDATQRLAFLLLAPRRQGLVRHTPRQLPALGTSPEGPALSALTRLEAQRGPFMTTPHHDVLALDPIDRLLACLLDGRSLHEIGRDLRARVLDGSLTFDTDQETWPPAEVLRTLDERIGPLVARFSLVGLLI